MARRGRGDAVARAVRNGRWSAMCRSEVFSAVGWTRRRSSPRCARWRTRSARGRSRASTRRISSTRSCPTTCVTRERSRRDSDRLSRADPRRADVLEHHSFPKAVWRYLLEEPVADPQRSPTYAAAKLEQECRSCSAKWAADEVHPPPRVQDRGTDGQPPSTTSVGPGARRGAAGNAWKTRTPSRSAPQPVEVHACRRGCRRSSATSPSRATTPQRSSSRCCCRTLCPQATTRSLATERSWSTEAAGETI